MEFEGLIVSSRVDYSSTSLISFKRLDKTDTSISSNLEINQVLNLAKVRIDSSIFDKDTENLKVEPFVNPDEHFVLDGVTLDVQFVETNLKLLNLAHSKSILGIETIGKMIAKRSDEMEGTGSLVALLPFSQSLTFVRFLNRMKLFIHLRYVNLDYGQEVETLLDSLAGDQYVPKSVQVQTDYKEE